MNSSFVKSVAKKVTVTVETEDGMTYTYKFGDHPASRLQVNAVINQDYSNIYGDSFAPIRQMVTAREFNLKINY